MAGRPPLRGLSGLPVAGPFADNWENAKCFEAGEGDLLIDTYPKSGTTWVSEIVDLILHNGDTKKTQRGAIFERVPFVEFAVPGMPTGTEILETMKPPRVIKSHLPVHLVPNSFWEKKCKVIYVARNPKDVLVSYYHFCRFTLILPDPGTFEEFLQNFIEGNGRAPASRRPRTSRRHGHKGRGCCAAAVARLRSMCPRLPARAAHLFRAGSAGSGHLCLRQHRQQPANHRAAGTWGSVLLSYWYRNRSRPPAMTPHVKALTSPYPGSSVQRWPVPQDKVSWSVDWPEYQPVEYTAPSVLAQPPWADPPHRREGFNPKYNALDGPVQRTSLQGTYEVIEGSPRNPSGRTGVIGRGLLGRWGPNHAADPIITRWKRDSAGEKALHPESGEPVLQFVAIQRKDCGQWAIPGGMVDPGELVTATLRREFCEEALNSLESNGEEPDTEQRIQSLFSQEHLPVYRGYVDDPRNTDNAWMETQAVNYHDETGHILDKLALQAGDDAGKVQWVDISGGCSLYANHAHFIQIVAEQRGAHW